MANVAYYCLHKLRILPSQFNRLPTREKAFIIAAIQVRVEAEKEAEKKAKRRH